MSSDYYEFYDGSRIFTSLSEVSNLPIDLVNFLVAQVAALWLSGLFRGVLKSASPVIRHSVCLGFGIVMGYFCFGWYSIHLILLPTICFFLLKALNSRIVANVILVVSMVYLSCIHLHRQMYHRSSYTLDISGPLMVITQRLTSLAFSLQDGFRLSRTKVENGTSCAENKSAVANSDLGPPLFEIPSALEFFSFAFAFQTLMCGPVVFYEDYIVFIKGSKPAQMNGNSKPTAINSSPRWAVVSKVLSSMTAAVLYLALTGLYPIDKIKDMSDPTSEAARWSAWYLLWFAFASTLVIRCKYYHAWLLADAICNNSGIGYSSSSDTWDAVSNVDIEGFELAPNFRSAVASWNRNTNAWLRRVAYSRLPRRVSTAATYALSAIWHGYHPGYYATFATGALFTIAARKIRNAVRPLFQGTRVLKAMYDVITFTITRIFMTYTAVPFVLLDLAPTMAFYSRFYYSLHFVAIAALLMPTPRAKRPATAAKTINEEKPVTNGHYITNGVSNGVSNGKTVRERHMDG